MSVPNYQDFMNPCLKVFADSKEVIKGTDIVDKVSDNLGLSDEDRSQVLKSGESVVKSRVYWATYFMYRAGLLERPSRGYYKITEEGLRVVASGEKINDEFLMKYKAFADFMQKTNDNAKKRHEERTEQISCDNTDIDPEQRINDAIDEINVALEDEILGTLKSIDPKRFEQVVIDLMEAMDYGVGEATRFVADGGIDGIINEDELGLSKIYLQAKRYNDGKVNEVEMRDFVGALATNNVSKGVFITTSTFADKARNSASSAHGHTIVLIDGPMLAKLMREHNLGAKQKKNYDIKEFDASYFE